MFEMFYQVMFLTAEGWQTLENEEGVVCQYHNPFTALTAVAMLCAKPEVLDAMAYKVEVSHCYDMVTRAAMKHTVYTGLTQ